jgi:hypothetical protein
MSSLLDFQNQHQGNLLILESMFSSIDKEVIRLVYSTHKRKLELTIDALLLMTKDLPSPPPVRARCNVYGANLRREIV